MPSTRNHSDNLASNPRFLEKAKHYEGGVLGMASKVRHPAAAAAAAAAAQLQANTIHASCCACQVYKRSLLFGAPSAVPGTSAAQAQ
jgi:hypothetical protein